MASSTTTTTLSTTTTTTSSSTSSTSSTTTTSVTTSSSTTSSTTTATICGVRYNLMPSRIPSAILRRKNDERVESRGLPCLLYKRNELAQPSLQYDAFDRPIVRTGSEPQALPTFIIVEPYQADRDRTGDFVGKEIVDYPYVGTFKWNDGVEMLDIVEIAYEYALAAGLTKCMDGTPLPPTKDLYTRFKLVNRRTHGIRSDIINQFFLVPTEETWT